MSTDHAGNLAARLAGRFTPPPATPATTAAAGRWEDRHTRRTLWVDDELWDRLDATCQATGISKRAAVDEMLRAWLERHEAPGTVHRAR